ncbi:MAG: hypothetical protein V7642_1681 [Burkholderiales bacterium]
MQALRRHSTEPATVSVELRGYEYSVVNPPLLVREGERSDCATATVYLEES